MTEWQTFRLGKMVLTNQSTYSQKEDWQFVNYLDTGNITMNRIDEIQYINTSTDKLPSRARRKVKLNSIIYSTVRPNQLHYGIIKEQPENFLVSTGFAVIDVDFEKAVPDYIYYVLTQQEITEHLQAIAEQSVSAYPSIKPSDIENLELMIPDIKTQERIVSILSSIDEKIKKNNAINNNLEQQAQAIFDNMFPNTSSGDKFIGDFITPKRGKNLLSKNAILGDVPVVAGGLEPSTYHNVSNTQAPVLAISASGANAGYVSLWNTPIWSSDSSYIDSSMTNDVYFWYVLLKKRQTEIFDTQTGSAQPHIYPQHIATMPITNISNDDISTFTNTVTPIFERIGHNKAENIRLSALRDTLLPKLMSGELDVSDIDL
ncbi:restriction endonuclease subunit S [Dialister pneumosintes]|nr:restriction endonuclease subunit S [Dialister pneumosintes]